VGGAHACINANRKLVCLALFSSSTSFFDSSLAFEGVVAYMIAPATAHAPSDCHENILRPRRWRQTPAKLAAARVKKQVGWQSPVSAAECHVAQAPLHQLLLFEPEFSHCEHGCA